MTKQLHTSNYSRHGKDPLAYGITKVLPAWLPKMNQVLELCPDWVAVSAYKRKKMTWEDFSKIYFLALKTRGVEAQVIADSLPEGAILCCYERAGEHCHRHLAADWLRTNADIVITELQ